MTILGTANDDNSIKKTIFPLWYIAYQQNQFSYQPQEI